MQKIALLLVMFILIGFQVQAKTIIVGAHGGEDMYFGLGGGTQYDPFVKFDTNIELWEDGSSSIAEWDKRNDYGAHGVDAAIFYFAEQTSFNDVKALIIGYGTDPIITGLFIKNNYNPGDKIILIGYSSGARHLVYLTNALKLAGYPVHLLALLDPIIGGDIWIPSNVEKVALYYQTTGLPYQRGFHHFWIIDPSKTHYYSGHPKEIVDITVDYEHDRIPHYALPFELSVWQDLGQKMVSLASNGNGAGYANDNSPAIFTIGNHTHIIHDDYRCSKELPNGPILCWESGGDTNCWDAANHYEMTCDVEEVPVLRTDSSYKTTLDRSICAVVYNSSGGGNSNGGDPNNATESTGSGYNNDQGDNTWSGYDHDVGLKYLKIGKKSSDRWKGSKVWSINQIPGKRDFRAKLKRKGGKWKNVCAEVWFSHNKYFTDNDKYLGKECKKLSKKKYRKKKKKSVYIKDIRIPRMEAGKNYYFFTRVTYSGGVNPSSRSDSDEYVKVDIIDFSSKFKIDKISGETPLTVNFTNKSKVIKNDGVSGSVSHYWDFGDGHTSNGVNPAHTYTQAGTYTVRLTTTASWGETKISTATIVVTEPIPDPPVDTDSDGVIDDNELGDTDGDGISDYQESYLVDSDNDGVNDQLDSENSNPANDSDADGYTNEEEEDEGTNPLDASSLPNIPDDNDEGDNPVDACQETADTATNGGWGWNPVTEEGCLVDYSSDNGSDENDSEDYCHETADTSTNGGWGWNPVTQEGCLVVIDSNDDSEGINCEPTADTANNGGWGWNSVTEAGCLVNGNFDESDEDDSDNNDPENYCHATADTATNGGWGWNPITQEGCVVNP